MDLSIAELVVLRDLMFHDTTVPNLVRQYRASWSQAEVDMLSDMMRAIGDAIDAKT